MWNTKLCTGVNLLYMYCQALFIVWLTINCIFNQSKEALHYDFILVSIFFRASRRDFDNQGRDNNDYNIVSVLMGNCMQVSRFKLPSIVTNLSHCCHFLSHFCHALSHIVTYCPKFVTLLPCFVTLLSCFVTVLLLQ